MAVITIGTAGATWGMTAETGVLIQTSSQKISREKNEVRDEVGNVALAAYYNPLGKFNWSAVVVGTSGLAAAAPGVAITIANGTTGNGSPTGGIYTDDVEIAKTPTEFRKMTGTATQYGF